MKVFINVNDDVFDFGGQIRILVEYCGAFG